MTVEESTPTPYTDADTGLKFEYHRSKFVMAR